MSKFVTKRKGKDRIETTSLREKPEKVIEKRGGDLNALCQFTST